MNAFDGSGKCFFDVLLAIEADIILPCSLFELFYMGNKYGHGGALPLEKDGLQMLEVEAGRKEGGRGGGERGEVIKKNG
jgi:hypothetical protein